MIIACILFATLVVLVVSIRHYFRLHLKTMYQKGWDSKDGHVDHVLSQMPPDLVARAPEACALYAAACVLKSVQELDASPEDQAADVREYRRGLSDHLKGLPCKP